MKFSQKIRVLLPLGMHVLPFLFGYKQQILHCKKRNACEGRDFLLQEGIDKVVDIRNSKRKALYGRRKSCILPSITNDLHLLAYERKKMSHYSEYNICTLYLLWFFACQKNIYIPYCFLPYVMVIAVDGFTISDLKL